MGTQPFNALTPALYDQFSALVLDRTGLLFAADKRHDLGKKLLATMAFCDCSSLAEYYVRLEKQPSSSPDWERCIRELTVGETYFMRNKGHISALRNHILPSLIEQRKTTRFMRIWSAGCSTGEEPYSVAILLTELLPDVADWNINILATDLNRQSLAVAQRAQYRSWSFRGVEPGLVTRHFQEKDGWFRLNRDIQSMVRFAYLNLVEDGYPSLVNNTCGLDLILCRNVTIYFPFDVTTMVVGRFYNALTEGGWLIPGSSEPNLMTYRQFTPSNYPGAVVYRKPIQDRNKRPRSLSRVSEMPSTASTYPASRPVYAPKPAAGSALRTSARSVRDAKKALPDRISQIHYQDALTYWEQGRAEQAIALLEANIKRSSRHAPSYYALARIHAERGELVKAEELCERAIGLRRRCYEPYYILAMIHQSQGKNAQAIEALRKAVLYRPGCVVGHYTLHSLLSSQGQQEPALEALLKARHLLSLMPRNAVLEEGDGMMAGSLLDLIDRMLETA